MNVHTVDISVSRDRKAVLTAFVYENGRQTELGHADVPASKGTRKGSLLLVTEGPNDEGDPAAAKYRILKIGAMTAEQSVRVDGDGVIADGRLAMTVSTPSEAVSLDNERADTGVWMICFRHRDEDAKDPLAAAEAMVPECEALNHQCAKELSETKGVVKVCLVVLSAR